MNSTTKGMIDLLKLIESYKYDSVEEWLEAENEVEKDIIKFAELDEELNRIMISNLKGMNEKVSKESKSIRHCC